MTTSNGFTLEREEGFFIGSQFDYLALKTMTELEQAGKEVVWIDTVAIRLRKNLTHWSELTPGRAKNKEAIVRGCLSRLYRQGALSRPKKGRYMLTLTGLERYDELVEHFAQALDFDFPTCRTADSEAVIAQKIAAHAFSYNDFNNSILSQEDMASLAKDVYVLNQAV
ncbi:hypothetical protein EVJ20_07540 [Exiguobacterium sp. SH0S1]|uniref:hypothetical protein n=1 Tax=Exiguobacterium sp. SH0S1 TaxID=2510949 RepID=UPI00103F1E0D|nr:hypothetical protein [Exiguobacterium sp. SH0S1]TCI77805.1 hypothetical protein EVJ20_07540 [Exiguobacterium sp. SH0S1]